MKRRDVYIRLLNEGTEVFRPVSAIEVCENEHELEGQDMYDAENEEWEFLPGIRVKIEDRMLEGVIKFVAIEGHM